MDHGVNDPVTFDIIQNSLAGDRRRDVRGHAQDRDERDHLRGARHGHRHHRRDGEIAASGAGIPAFIGVLDKAVKAILRKHPSGEHRARATSSPSTILITAASPTSTTSCSPCRSSSTARSSPGPPTSPISTTSAAWCQARCRRTPTKSFRRAFAFRRSSSSRPASRTSTVIDVLTRQFAPARLPQGRSLGGDRGGSDRRAAPRRTRARNTASRLFRPRSGISWTTASRSRSTALEGLPQGRFELAEEQDDGSVFKVTIEITDTTFVVDLTRQSRPGPRADQRQPRRRHHLRADGVQGVQLRRIRRPTPARSARCACSPRPGIGIRCRRSRRRIGFYFEVEVRVFDLMLRCLAPHMPDRLAGRRISPRSAAP